MQEQQHQQQQRQPNSSPRRSLLGRLSHLLRSGAGGEARGSGSESRRSSSSGGGGSGTSRRRSTAARHPSGRARLEQLLALHRSGGGGNSGGGDGDDGGDGQEAAPAALLLSGPCGEWPRVLRIRGGQPEQQQQQQQQEQQQRQHQQQRMWLSRDGAWALSAAPGAGRQADSLELRMLRPAAAAAAAAEPAPPSLPPPPPPRTIELPPYLRDAGEWAAAFVADGGAAVALVRQARCGGEGEAALVGSSGGSGGSTTWVHLWTECQGGSSSGSGGGISGDGSGGGGGGGSGWHRRPLMRMTAGSSPMALDAVFAGGADELVVRCAAAAPAAAGGGIMVAAASRSFGPGTVIISSSGAAVQQQQPLSRRLLPSGAAPSNVFCAPVLASWQPGGARCLVAASAADGRCWLLLLAPDLELLHACRWDEAVGGQPASPASSTPEPDATAMVSASGVSAVAWLPCAPGAAWSEAATAVVDGRGRLGIVRWSLSSGCSGGGADGGGGSWRLEQLQLMDAVSPACLLLVMF